MVWRRKVDSEQRFDEELETHLAMLTERLIDKGMPPADLRISRSSKLSQGAI